MKIAGKNVASTSTALSSCRSTVYFHINCINSWRICLWHCICSKHVAERTEICLNHKLSCEEKGARVQGTSSSGQCMIRRGTRLLKIQNIARLLNIFGEFHKLLLNTYLINNLQTFMQIRDSEDRLSFHLANILHFVSSTFVKFFWHLCVSYKRNEIRWE